MKTRFIFATIEECGCIVIWDRKLNILLDSPLSTDGSISGELGEVTAPDKKFLRKCNAIFGTNFKMSNFAGR